MIIDSIRQIQGVNLVRCSKCLAFLEADKLTNCPNCRSLICGKCGHCHCELSKGRELAYELQKDSWPDEKLAY